MTATATKRLRFPEAAAHVGLSESGFKKLHYAGQGPPFFKVGTSVVFDLGDLEQWLESHRRGSVEVDEERARAARNAMHEARKRRTVDLMYRVGRWAVDAHGRSAVVLDVVRTVESEERVRLARLMLGTLTSEERAAALATETA